MSNPRKFSEKIALHNQKQAEETAAFEKIMREVSDATSKVDDIALDATGQDSSNDDNGLRSNSSSSNNNNSSNHKSINSNNTSNTNSTNNSNDATSNKQQIPYRESRGRSVGGGPIRSRQGSRNIDTSPYGSQNVAYLSPPNDTVWRRTSSDSAIHQSLSQSEADGHLHAMHPQLSFSPAVQKRMSVSVNSSRTFNYQNEIYNTDNSQDLRRNVSGLQRLPPGIKVHPSSYDNSIQIPIGNNTGSLPDLTLVHIPSPMPTPIDHEHDQNTSSPYSTSPLVTTPTSMSPTTMSNRQNQINCQISNNLNSYSSKNYENNPSQHYLSVPDSNRYHQFNKILDNSYQNSPNNLYDQDYVQSINQISGPAQQSKDIPLNKTGYGSHGNIVQQTLLSGYRSPKGRPSPGSSPGIISNMSPNLDSNSSAPCSPVPQGMNGQNYDQYQNSTDNYYINQFEQFSLDWAALVQSLVESGCTLTAQVQLDSPISNEYGSPALSSQQYVQFEDASFGQFNTSSNVLINTNSNNRNVASLNCGGDNDDSLQQTQLSSQISLNSTATTTQIPEIVFTDFSSDINDSLKLDIESIDFDGFQMLSEPNTTMIADPTIEDSFRRDLN